MPGMYHGIVLMMNSEAQAKTAGTQLIFLLAMMLMVLIGAGISEIIERAKKH